MTANLAVAKSAAKKTLHYRLTAAEWIRAVRELTESQKDLLYYIRTLNPFGDRHLDLGVRQLAEILDYSPSTISRALNALAEKGYIALEMVSVRVRILAKGQPTPPSRSVAPKQQTLHQNNDCCAETTSVAPTQHPLHPRNTQDPDPIPSNDSRTSHTIQTLKITHSSSFSERDVQKSQSWFDSNESEIEVDQEKRKPKPQSQKFRGEQHNFSTNPNVETQTDIVTDSNVPPPQWDPQKNQPQSTSLPIYRDSINPQIVKNGFIQFLQRWLGTIPPQRSRSRADALAYIRNQESTGDLTVLNSRANQWIREQEQRRDVEKLIRQTQAHVHVSVDSPGGTLDLSELLTEIDIHCRRLNLDKQSAIAHMVEHCGWSESSPVVKARAFDRLTDSDLLALLTELKSM